MISLSLHRRRTLHTTYYSSTCSRSTGFVVNTNFFLVISFGIACFSFHTWIFSFPLLAIKQFCKLKHAHSSSAAPTSNTLQASSIPTEQYFQVEWISSSRYSASKDTGTWRTINAVLTMTSTLNLNWWIQNGARVFLSTKIFVDFYLGNRYKLNVEKREMKKKVNPTPSMNFLHTFFREMC